MRHVYLQMIKAVDGGWNVMAAALGLTRDGLENRIYERKGQTVSADLALQMQKVSKTTLYSEAVAKEGGGVFLLLPETGEQGNEELLSKFMELNAELGEMATQFKDAVRDNEIDSAERRELEVDAQKIHRSVQELLSLAFSIYCRHNQEGGKS